MLQKLEKAAVAFVNSAYGVDVVDLCVGKQDEAAPPTAGSSTAEPDRMGIEVIQHGGAPEAPPERAAFYFDFTSPEAYLSAERVLGLLPFAAEWIPIRSPRGCWAMTFGMVYELTQLPLSARYGASWPA